MPFKYDSLEDRFWEKVLPEPNSGCWLWDSCGSTYGRLRLPKPSKNKIAAHRLSWQIHNGDIPKNMCVCHKCDNPCCVNPDHLFLGTQAGNMADMARKKRTPDRRGENAGNSKLTKEDALDIRESNLPCRGLMSIYGISDTQVYNIKNRRQWNHI